MIRNRFSGRFLVALLLLQSGILQAEIYKWIDSQGNVHFGDRPASEHAEKVDINTSVTDAQRQDAERINREYQKLYEDFKQQDAAREAHEKQQLAKKQERQKKCRKISKYVKAANSDLAFVKYNEDGSRAYLTDDEIAAYRAEVNSTYNKLCSDL